MIWLGLIMVVLRVTWVLKKNRFTLQKNLDLKYEIQ